MKCEPSSAVLESRMGWWSYDRSSTCLGRPWLENNCPKGWDTLRHWMASMHQNLHENHLLFSSLHHTFHAAAVPSCSNRMVLISCSTILCCIAVWICLKPEVCDDACSSRLATWSPKDKTPQIHDFLMLSSSMLRYSATPNLRQVHPSCTFWVRCL